MSAQMEPTEEQLKLRKGRVKLEYSIRVKNGEEYAGLDFDFTEQEKAMYDFLFGGGRSKIWSYIYNLTYDIKWWPIRIPWFIFKFMITDGIWLMFAGAAAGSILENRNKRS